MSATLETRSLTFGFGSNPIISGVDFALSPGDRRALIGPNGAGKTTFLNLLTGRLRPTGGAISLDGEDVTGLDEARRSRRGIGRTFQITSLFPAMTVRENVFLAVAERDGVAARLLRAVRSHGPQLARVEEIVDRVGLGDVADVAAQLLPYGRQRLLELAVALALRPKILLLDEPAAGIPSAETRVILDVVAGLPDDIAVLLIDHDMDLVFRFARQITVLVRGSILVEGTPDEIAGDPRVADVYLGDNRHGRAAAA